MDKISNRIKELRAMLKITQQELADKIGVSNVSVLRWEKGIRSPRMREIKKISEALNTSVEYLMGLTDDATPINLPINSFGENKILNDDLDLSYWGGVVEKAERVALSNDNGKKKLIVGMLRMALDAVTGTRGATGEQAPVEVHHNNINGRDFNFAAQA